MNKQGLLLSVLIFAVLVVGSVAVNAGATDGPPKADSALKPSAETSATPNGAIDPQLQPEEIEVKAERLSRIVVQLHKTQDTFFAEFNRVNTNPDYTTHCDRREISASRLPEHICTPQFVEDANERYAAKIDTAIGDTVYGNISGYDGNLMFASLFSEDRNQQIAAKMPDYRRTVMTVAMKDPQLNKTAREYDALTKKFADVRRAKVKAHWWYVWD